MKTSTRLKSEYPPTETKMGGPRKDNEQWANWLNVRHALQATWSSEATQPWLVVSTTIHRGMQKTLLRKSWHDTAANG